MIFRSRKSRTAVLIASFAALAASGGGFGCAASRVDRAIEARGGPLPSWSKEVEAAVHAGMPGQWTWQVAYRVPWSFRWSLHATGDDQRLLYDGEAARYQLGAAALAPTEADRAIRSQARWFAATSLDVLREADVSWRELPVDALPGGAAWGIAALFPGDPGELQLFFDERNLLARARGQVWFEPIGAGMVDAAFSDYREVDGFWLPFAGEYLLDGAPLLRESVRSWYPDDPALTPELFSGR